MLFILLFENAPPFSYKKADISINFYEGYQFLFLFNFYKIFKFNNLRFT